MSRFEARQVLSFNCRFNYDNGRKETVFFFPNEIRFVNRKGWKPSKESCICKKHFSEPHYYKAGAEGKR